MKIQLEPHNLEPSFRNLLENWESINPNFKHIFNQLLGFLDNCANAITGHNQDFSKSTDDTICKLGNYTIVKEFREDWTFCLLKIWTVSGYVMKLVEDLFDKIQEYKDEEDKLGQLSPTPRRTREKELLDLKHDVIGKLRDTRFGEIQDLSEKINKIATNYS